MAINYDKVYDEIPKNHLWWYEYKNKKIKKMMGPILLEKWFKKDLDDVKKDLENVIKKFCENKGMENK
jgi:hypothetical protein